MTKEITSAQAMQHPTVVATINVLSGMNQRLQDENDELKAALAQEQQSCDKPEQEPAVWLTGCPSCGMGSCDCEEGTWNPPPQRPWVGLTDEEAQLIYDMGRTPAGMMEMVEAKLKEKNT